MKFSFDEIKEALLRYQEITETPVKVEIAKTDSASGSVQPTPVETQASEAVKITDMEQPDENENEGLKDEPEIVKQSQQPEVAQQPPIKLETKAEKKIKEKEKST